MTLNPVFNFHENTLEQQLYEDLIVESIQMYGYDLSYIPRRIGSYNKILNEDAGSYFDTVYPLEMYIKSVNGFNGDITFLSKFNVEVRNGVTFTVAKRRFHTVVGTPENVNRPKEGDLLYFRMDKKLLYIKKVQEYEVFYQTGILQTWDLECEPYEYQGEHFYTGNPDIDAVEDKYSLNTSSGGLMVGPLAYLLDEDGFPLLTEEIDLDVQNIDYGSESEEFNEDAGGLIDFSEDNPFSENF